MLENRRDAFEQTTTKTDEESGVATNSTPQAADEFDLMYEASNINSNLVLVSDVGEVRRIVDSYVFGGFRVEIVDRGNQSAICLVRAMGRSPVALKKTDILRIKAYADMDETDWYELAEYGGEAGFEAFLIELASFIESPLMVLNIETNQEFDEFGSTAWLIQPGGKEVQTVGVGLDF